MPKVRHREEALIRIVGGEGLDPARHEEPQYILTYQYVDGVTHLQIGELRE